MFFPVQFKTVETDHVLQIHQDHAQRVQLVSQPEVCEADAMKWSRHHSKLWKKGTERTVSQVAAVSLFIRTLSQGGLHHLMPSLTDLKVSSFGFGIYFECCDGLNWCSKGFQITLFTTNTLASTTTLMQWHPSIHSRRIYDCVDLIAKRNKSLVY